MPQEHSILILGATTAIVTAEYLWRRRRILKIAGIGASQRSERLKRAGVGFFYGAAVLASMWWAVLGIF